MHLIQSFGETLLEKPMGLLVILEVLMLHWDEDYWWGVGSGNISVNPSYNSQVLVLMMLCFICKMKIHGQWLIVQ